MALFRLDWFITVFQIVALSAVLLALALDNFMQARYHFGLTMNLPCSNRRSSPNLFCHSFILMLSSPLAYS